MNLSMVKEKAVALKDKANLKLLAVPGAAAAMAVGTAVTAFAEEPAAGGGSSLPSISITTDMLTPLVEGVVANVGVILPVGLGLFAIFLGIRIIPGLISRFVKM